MPGRGTFERELARITALRRDPTRPEAAGELRQALAARSNLLVARAAEIIGEWELGQYVPELSAAFDRLLVNAARRDPTCAAKYAIAEALNRLEVRDAGLFLRGVRHVQPEPVWGGQEDTAAGLRAVCALGLARSDPPDILFDLARLLSDPQSDARIGAVRAIAYATRPGGAPLLWYKVYSGDPEPAVLYECFGALLALEPTRALPLVGDRTRSEDAAIAEAALAALGNARLPDALPVLSVAWQKLAEPALRRAALYAIAALGDEASFNFLLDLLAAGATYDATEASGALGLFRDDERRRRKIERVLRRRDDLPLPG